MTTAALLTSSKVLKRKASNRAKTSKASTLTTDTIDRWADDPKGPVALHLRQKLISIEGPDSVVFPPTYAVGEKELARRKDGTKYQIDTLSDGSKVVQLDSVGSQANRMEPLFKAAKDGLPKNPLAALVPQVDIDLGNGKIVSLLDAGHRLGDAIVRSSELHEQAKLAFAELRNGDATRIAKLAPTSVVFGAWNSRGDQAKAPRIVQAVVRAWDVEPLTRSAQYNPPVDYSSLDIFTDKEKQKAEGDSKSPLAKRGFVHVPSVADDGGVLVRGGIYRDITINLIALRQLDGQNGVALRRYILGLALVVAVEPLDGFLRQGCLLTLDPDDVGSGWTEVQRTGERISVDLTPATALAYAQRAAKAFSVGEGGTFTFSKDAAKEDVKSDGGRIKPQEAPSPGSAVSSVVGTTRAAVATSAASSGSVGSMRAPKAAGSARSRGRRLAGTRGR
jgi:CRISPR-associated protein Csb1